LQTKVLQHPTVGKKESFATGDRETKRNRKKRKIYSSCDGKGEKGKEKHGGFAGNRREIKKKKKLKTGQTKKAKLKEGKPRTDRNMETFQNR